MDEPLRGRLLDRIERSFRESVQAKEELCRRSRHVILDMAETIAESFRCGCRLFLFGNGGSAADAQHLAAEFVNRFALTRPPLPALALTVDSSVITSISNDYQFRDVFLRQLQALGRPRDVALGISTSGRSPNVTAGLAWARENGLATLGMGGALPTEMDAHCDLVLHVPSENTARIQECHITAGHILCGLVEEILFGQGAG